jgi:integrase
MLLDTGLRVCELAKLTKYDILWQERRLKIREQRRAVRQAVESPRAPMIGGVRHLVEHHYTMEDDFGITKRHIE